jgi:rubrerythrin
MQGKEAPNQKQASTAEVDYVRLAKTIVNSNKLTTREKAGQSSFDYENINYRKASKQAQDMAAKVVFVALKEMGTAGNMDISVKPVSDDRMYYKKSGIGQKSTKLVAADVVVELAHASWNGKTAQVKVAIADGKTAISPTMFVDNMEFPFSIEGIEGVTAYSRQVIKRASVGTHIVTRVYTEDFPNGYYINLGQYPYAESLVNRMKTASKNVFTATIHHPEYGRCFEVIGDDAKARNAIRNVLRVAQMSMVPGGSAVTPNSGSKNEGVDAPAIGSEEESLMFSSRAEAEKKAAQLQQQGMSYTMTTLPNGKVQVTVGRKVASQNKNLVSNGKNTTPKHEDGSKEVSGPMAHQKTTFGDGRRVGKQEARNDAVQHVDKGGTQNEDLVSNGSNPQPEHEDGSKHVKGPQKSQKETFGDGSRTLKPTDEGKVDQFFSREKGNAGEKGSIQSWFSKRNKSAAKYIAQTFMDKITDKSDYFDEDFDDDDEFNDNDKFEVKSCPMCGAVCEGCTECPECGEPMDSDDEFDINLVPSTDDDEMTPNEFGDVAPDVAGFDEDYEDDEETTFKPEEIDTSRVIYAAIKGVPSNKRRAAIERMKKASNKPEGKKRIPFPKESADKYDDLTSKIKDLMVKFRDRQVTFDQYNGQLVKLMRRYPQEFQKSLQFAVYGLYGNNNDKDQNGINDKYQQPTVSNLNQNAPEQSVQIRQPAQKTALWGHKRKNDSVQRQASQKSSKYGPPDGHTNPAPDKSNNPVGEKNRKGEAAPTPKKVLPKNPTKPPSGEDTSEALKKRTGFSAKDKNVAGLVRPISH